MDIEKENTKENIQSLRMKSMLGLMLFGTSVIVGYFYLNHPIVGALSIAGLLSGWYIFSHYNTKITSIKLKKITVDYLNDKFKEKN